ncbi:MAG: hypothetical protein ACTHMA_10450 [Thermomicrobiales bacterium]|jgi:hypothetical protein|nr:hypothetical protein [Thermomicrobiales bacterium]
MAARRRNTFLIHSWWLGDTTRRLVIEHVQSGERIAVASLTAALDWLSARDTADDSPTATGAVDMNSRPAREESDS